MNSYSMCFHLVEAKYTLYLYITVRVFNPFTDELCFMMKVLLVTRACHVTYTYMSHESTPCHQSMSHESTPCNQGMSHESTPSHQGMSHESTPCNQGMSHVSTPCNQGMSHESTPCNQGMLHNSACYLVLRQESVKVTLLPKTAKLSGVSSIISFAYPPATFGVDMSSLLNKVLHRVNPATLSSLV